MYSDKKNVLQLVALLRAHGIRRAVLCPGSRNVPLVQAFATCEDFECFSVTDERSAGFFAVGLALHVQAPVVVCCTSGSALLNLHPAVGGVLPSGTFGSRFCRPTGGLDRADGRADFAAAGCFRWLGAEGGQPARGTYRGR